MTVAAGGGAGVCRDRAVLATPAERLNPPESPPSPLPFPLSAGRGWRDGDGKSGMQRAENRSRSPNRWLLLPAGNGPHLQRGSFIPLFHGDEPSGSGMREKRSPRPRLPPPSRFQRPLGPASPLAFPHGSGIEAREAPAFCSSTLRGMRGRDGGSRAPTAPGENRGRESGGSALFWGLFQRVLGVAAARERPRAAPAGWVGWVGGWWAGRRGRLAEMQIAASRCASAAQSPHGPAAARSSAPAGAGAAGGVPPVPPPLGRLAGGG